MVVLFWFCFFSVCVIFFWFWLVGFFVCVFYGCFFFFADCKLLLAKHSEYHGNRVDGKISINNRN